MLDTEHAVHIEHPVSIVDKDRVQHPQRSCRDIFFFFRLTMERWNRRTLVIGGVCIVICLLALTLGITLTSGPKVEESDEKEKTVDEVGLGVRILGTPSPTVDPLSSVANSFDDKESQKENSLKDDELGTRIMDSFEFDDSNSIEFDLPSNNNENRAPTLPPSNDNKRTTWKPPTGNEIVFSDKSPSQDGIVFPGPDSRPSTPSLDGSRINFDSGTNMGTSGRGQPGGGSAVKFPSSNDNQGESGENWGEDNSGLGNRIGPVNPCHLPKVAGDCRMHIPSWFFDPQTGDCMQFVFGGCGGNENRFSSQDECRNICNHGGETVEVF